MRYLKLTSLLACGAALVVASGCSDMPAPLEPEPIELDLQVQRDAGSGEKCWYVGSHHPKWNQHVVSGQDLFVAHYGLRFSQPLPTPGFFPEDPPLVAHVIGLFKDGTNFESENRVGTGYVVSVVGEKMGRTYNMFHQIVLQPWMGPEDGGDPTGRDYDYNAGLCENAEPVHVCMLYDIDPNSSGYGSCLEYVYRPACIGTVLGTSSIDCNSLPCTNNLHRADVTFDSGTWEGFGQFASAGMHHGRGGELRQGTGDFATYALLYGWHHGNFCVAYGGGGGVDPEPEPDPEPDPDPDLAASFTYSCGNSPVCTFTDASSGAVATWSWTFQNGAPGSASEVGPHTVTYSSAGKHAVTLQVSGGQNTDTAVGEVSCTSHPRFGIRCN